MTIKYLISEHLDTGHLNRFSHRRCYQRFLAGCILALIGLMPTCAISTPEEIRQAHELAPDIENGKKIYRLCANCHMNNGWGKNDGSFPVIAGQHRNVLIKQLSLALNSQLVTEQALIVEGPPEDSELPPEAAAEGKRGRLKRWL